jgi:TfoX/Sxy family transcriptional regulator of competence genes
MQKAHEIFDPIAADHLTRPGVDIGRMFSTEGLRVRGKVYAFVEHEGGLIVKVPQSRADELAATGAASRMVMREREMREWVTVPLAAGAERWRELIDEGHDFVDAITPR